MMGPMPTNHYSAAALHAMVGDFVNMNHTDRPLLILIAGPYRSNTGDDPAKVFNEIFHPISRRLIDRIDAVLRIGGASRGADEMVILAREAGKRTYSSISEIAKVEA
jgi:hypothetical protein